MNGNISKGSRVSNRLGPIQLDKIMTRILVLIFMFFSLTCEARLVFQKTRGTLSVCQSLLQNLNESGNINEAVKLTGFNAIPFQQSELSAQFFKDGPVLNNEPIEVLYFDINNDGKPDTIIKYETWLHQSPGDLLWISPNSQMLRNNELPFLSPSEFEKLDSVESMSPWPYEQQGLMFTRIAILQREGTTYLSLRDTLLGNRKFPERRWVIAKYTDKKIESDGYHKYTDDLEVVCSFSMSDGK